MLEKDSTAHRSHRSIAQRQLCIVIPIYKNPHLIEPLLNSLIAQVPDIEHLQPEALLVNDSPEDLETTKEIDRGVQKLLKHMKARVLTSPQNQGFVKAANLGLDYCIAHQADALLLNSDVILAQGCLKEMERIFEKEPKIGLVNPRSNNASICSLPIPPEKGEFNQAYERFLSLSPQLPEWQYAPTGVGFCLWIKGALLAEFGTLDPIYGHGYNEENDFCMRANRAGYRVALANRAFAYHIGSVSFTEKTYREKDEANRKILDQRYPEYTPFIHSYFSSAQFAFEKLVSQKSQDLKKQLNLLIDFSDLADIHCGTTQSSLCTLEGIIQLNDPRLKISAIINPEAAEFHQLKKRFPNLELLPIDTSRVFDVALRFCQPLGQIHFTRLAERALYNFYVILDTIAADCYYLSPSRELDGILEMAARYADGLMHISTLTKNRFLARYPFSSKKPHKTCLLSLDPKDYILEEKGQSHWKSKNPRILIIGNKLVHKFVKPTAEQLIQAFPDAEIHALGLQPETVPGVYCIPSGKIPDAELHAEYRECDILIFPSHFEGFGLPCVTGMSYGKIVYCRDTPLADEIRNPWKGGGSLRTYDRTSNLIEELKKLFAQPQAMPPKTNPHSTDVQHYGWTDCARLTLDFIDDCIAQDPDAKGCKERLEFLSHYSALTEALKTHVHGYLEPTVRNLVQERDHLKSQIEHQLQNQVKLPDSEFERLAYRGTQKALQVLDRHRFLKKSVRGVCLKSWKLLSSVRNWKQH